LDREPTMKLSAVTLDYEGTIGMDGIFDRPDQDHGVYHERFPIFGCWSAIAWFEVQASMRAMAVE
jgi:hypothetical protein